MSIVCGPPQRFSVCCGGNDKERLSGKCGKVSRRVFDQLGRRWQRNGLQSGNDGSFLNEERRRDQRGRLAAAAGRAVGRVGLPIGKIAAPRRTSVSRQRGAIARLDSGVRGRIAQRQENRCAVPAADAPSDVKRSRRVHRQRGAHSARPNQRSDEDATALKIFECTVQAWVEASPVPMHGRMHLLTLKLPPLGAVFLKAA